jgi:hypothetical protein
MDFNAIINRWEKSGASFDHKNSQQFNSCIDVFALHDLKCPDRQFNWAREGRSTQLASLDRYLVSPGWINLYSIAVSLVFLGLVPIIILSALSLASILSSNLIYFDLRNVSFIKKVFRIY